MSDNAEYDKLVSQKRSAQSRYNSCQSRIDNCNYLLRRLRKAKESISDLKKSFKDNKKLDEKLRKEKCDWEGFTYDSFKSKMSTLIDTNDDYFKGSIDKVLDSLNNEITRIENKRMSEYGLLGELGSWINSLANKIENFFN